MKYQIINTTDKKFIGEIIDDNIYPIIINDFEMHFDKVITTSEGKIFANSNYVIETIKKDK